MKAKDMICYVGAPVRTIVEGAGIGGAIGGIIWGLAILINHGFFTSIFLAMPNFWWWVGHVFVAAYFVVVFGFIGAALVAAFCYRTQNSFEKCKQYWQGN